MKKLLVITMMIFSFHSAFSQWNALAGYVQLGPDYYYEGYLDFDVSPDNSIYVVYRYSGYSIHYTYFKRAKSADGGLNWTFPGIGPTTTLYKIQCVAPSQLVTFVTDQMTSSIRTTSDDFLTWEGIPGSNVDGFFNGYDFIDISRGFALNNYPWGLLGKVENGEYSSTPGDSVDFAYGSVKMLNDTTAFILCRDFNYPGSTVPGNNMLLKTTDFGNTWTTIYKDTLYNLNHFTFINEDTGVLVGKEGTILQTTDGGISWTPMESGTVNAINYITERYGSYFCVGDNGLILNRESGSDIWNDISFGTLNYLKIKLDSNMTGYILTPTSILRSDEVLEAGNDPVAETIVFYPNPCSDQLNYSFSNLNLVKQIRLQNSSGQEVLSVTGSFNGHLDVSDLDSGIYFVSFDTGDAVVTRKLVIIR